MTDPLILREADARRDAKARAIAVKRYNHLVRWMDKQLAGPGLRARKTPTGSYVWSWREIFGNDSGPSWLVFDRKSDKWGGAIEWGRTGPEMHLYILDDRRPSLRDAVDALASTQSWRDIFVHEFIHWMDKARGVGGDWDTSGLRNTQGDLAYYLDPKEFNAYFQQGANEVSLNVAGISRSPIKHLLKRFLGTPQKFVAKHTDPSSTAWHREFIRSLQQNPHWMRKFQKRLVTLHAHLTSRYLREAHRKPRAVLLSEGKAWRKADLNAKAKRNRRFENEWLDDDHYVMSTPGPNAPGWPDIGDVVDNDDWIIATDGRASDGEFVADYGPGWAVVRVDWRDE
jgi:hypothetical protein